MRRWITPVAALVCVAVAATGCTGSPKSKTHRPVPSASTPAGPADTTRNIAYRQWSTTGEFGAGAADGVKAAGDALTITKPVGTLDYQDADGGRPSVSYEYATWTSPEVSPGFAASEAI